MKEHTSKLLKVIALAFVAFPVLYLLVSAVVFDIPAKALIRIILSPSYYFLSFCSILTGYALWEMKRWSWFIFLFTIILIGYTNAVVASEYGESHHKIVGFLCSTAVLVGLLFQVGREVRVPYFLPRIRWWESNPRYRLVVPARIVRSDGASLDGEILDLSMGGCFFKVRTDLKQDEPLTIRFAVFGLELQCPGTVVWRTQSTVTNPKGVGVKFAPLPKNQKKMLKAINQHLKKITKFYRSSRYLLSQEDFLKRMQEMQNQKLASPAPRGDDRAASAGSA